MFSKSRSKLRRRPLISANGDRVAPFRPDAPAFFGARRQRQERAGDPRQGRRLSARGQIQPLGAARRDRESLRLCGARIDTFVDFDKGHVRIEQRSISVITEVD
jgi:hypothetical protein